MFFRPKWYMKLPLHLKPEDDKVKDLEALRIELCFSDDVFTMGIANSRWSVIQAQKAILEKLKDAMPSATEKELWRGVLFSRLEVKLKIPSHHDLPADIILHKMETMDEIMVNINSFDNLIQYIIEMDKGMLDDSDPIQIEIDKILLK